MKRLRGRQWPVVCALATFALASLIFGVNLRYVAAQDSGAVTIVDFAFDPASLEVPVGSAVTWTNTGAAPHTVTADDGAFNSGELAPGATFSQTFDAAGTFAYHCEIHPDMTAAIVVADTAAPADAAAPAETPAAAAEQAAGTPAAATGGQAQTQAQAAAPNQLPRTGSGATALTGSGELALLAGLAVVMLGLAAAAYRRA
jgi:plastocyanin